MFKYKYLHFKYKYEYKCFKTVLEYKYKYKYKYKYYISAKHIHSDASEISLCGKCGGLCRIWQVSTSLGCRRFVIFFDVVRGVRVGLRAAFSSCSATLHANCSDKI